LWELAVLTRANDYSLLWASSAQASHRADLTVKDAEEACQHLIDRSVRGVFFAPFEFAPDKDRVSKRTVDEISIVYLIKIETGLEHEGYVSRGRKAEEGRIADRYSLVELTTKRLPFSFMIFPSSKPQVSLHLLDVIFGFNR
jgi:hypothetical protein